MKRNLSLKHLIERLGFTYGELGTEIGVSADTVRRWVSGRIPLKEDDARLIEAVTGANAQDLVPGTDGGVTVSEAHRFCCSYLHPGVQRKDWSYTEEDFRPTTLWDKVSMDYQIEHLSWRVRVLLMEARSVERMDGGKRLNALRCAIEAALKGIVKRFSLNQHCGNVIGSQNPMVKPDKLQQLLVKAFEDYRAARKRPDLFLDKREFVPDASASFRASRRSRSCE